VIAKLTNSSSHKVIDTLANLPVKAEITIKIRVDSITAKAMILEGDKNPATV
jgi:hypothetical protein